MKTRGITDTAILIGWSPEAVCVYSASIPLGDYWDGQHVWDSTEGIQKLKLEKLRGFLFDSKGDLLQEFESNFDVQTGRFKSGWAKHADGTFQRRDA